MLFVLLVLGIVVALTQDPDVEVYEEDAPVLEATPTPAPISTDVRREATKAGFGTIAQRLEQASLPTLIVEPGGKGASRLGGDPDLPRDGLWPQCKGRPQSFLGQIELSELGASADELRRHGGTLLFFTHVEFEPGEREYGLWAGECSTVVHVPAGAATLRQKPPREAMRLKSTRVRLIARRDIPEVGGDELLPPLEGVELPDWERYWDLRYGLRGNPDLEHRLLGYHDEPNGGDECSERAERPKDTWRHLFTIGYDEDLGFEVADGGRLQVLISPKDLRTGRFDRVCGVFDSG